MLVVTLFHHLCYDMGTTFVAVNRMLIHMISTRILCTAGITYGYINSNRRMPNVVVDGVMVNRLINGVVVHPRMLVGGFGGTAAVRAAGGLG